MKEYIVRLRNYEGFIVDGEIYSAFSKEEALKMYKERCNKLGISKCLFDFYTIDEI